MPNHSGTLTGTSGLNGPKSPYSEWRHNLRYRDVILTDIKQILFSEKLGLIEICKFSARNSAWGGSMKRTNTE